jgi:hypothetical protein
MRRLVAWGLFAYARNRSTPEIQDGVVSRCFAYGRVYGETVNHRAAMSAAWYATTDDVNGGRCHAAGRPCAVVPDAPNVYRSPAAVATRTHVGADDWLNLQFYRLVRGRRGGVSGSGQRWDCRSTDWRLHWTSRQELYCYKDFLRILDAVPDTVVVTDPAGVATAWGRVPPFGR